MSTGTRGTSGVIKTLDPNSLRMTNNGVGTNQRSALSKCDQGNSFYQSSSASKFNLNESIDNIDDDGKFKVEFWRSIPRLVSMHSSTKSRA